MRRFVPFLFFASSFALICAETLLSTHDDQGVFSNNGNVKKYLKEDGSKSLDANEENVLVQDVSSNTMPSPTYHRILSIETNSRWKDRMGSVIQVPYYIDPTYFDADQAVVIEDAIIKLSEAVNVVQFIPRSNQAAYIHIQDNGTGCNSIIGKIGTGKSQELNLRRNSCLNIGTIQHELLHAIGFRHEQARPDRDAYVRINFDNIDEKQKSNFVIAESSQLLGSQYDYGSVMHYSRTAFALDENVDTVIPLDSGATIGQRDGASSWDIAKVHLLYQCISGPRDYSSYASNPCTADCPCWEGIEGCNGDSTACRGGLVCSDNVCVVDTSTGGGGTGTGGGSCTDVPDWIDRDGDGCMWYEVNNACSEYGNVPGADAFGKTANEACCICGGGSFSGGVTFLEFRSNEISTECLDLYAASTTNGNRIIQYGCNGTPGQQWFVDSNFYIRSALDTNKCIVGSSGSTAAGTNLIIHDCISNDSRFVFTYYDDNTFRPAADTNQCVGSSSSDIFNGWWGIELSDCAGSLNQQWLPYRPSTRRNLLGETKDESGLRGLQDDSCTDLPDGWYDKSGDNCAWYAEGTNCHDYGSQNRNFGKTANQACCACGGGSSALADFDMNMGDGDQEAPAAGVELDDIGCYDFPDFRDNVGDGCMWYAQGINCEYYGAQFRSEMGTANEACCICGGGTADPPALNDESISPGCSNSPSNWMDIDGDNCAFYAIGNNCQAFGDKYIGVASKTANMACCACGGGSTPNQQALDADIDTTNGSTNYDNASTNDTSAARAPSPLFWTISCLFFFVSVQYLLPTLM